MSFVGVPPKATHLVQALFSLVVFTLALISPGAIFGQQPQRIESETDLRKEIEALKQGQIAIQKELQEIKTLLLARQRSTPEPPREFFVDTDGAHFKGEKNAKLTLIEFSDYQCPFCSRYVQETLPQIERDYIKTGKVKYVFRDFPIESIHQNAFLAAVAANCAGEEGKYWEMHDRLFSNQSLLASENLLLHAKAIQLDESKFRQCLQSKKYEAGIRQSLTEALALGVKGTPTFFLGFTTPDDPKVRIIASISGARSYANFKEVIDKALISSSSKQ